jgi:hypothetical protein
MLRGKIEYENQLKPSAVSKLNNYETAGSPI